MTTKALSPTITVDMDEAGELWDSGTQDGNNRIRLMISADCRHIWAETNGDPVIDRWALWTLLDERTRGLEDRRMILAAALYSYNGLDMQCDECGDFARYIFDAAACDRPSDGRTRVEDTPGTIAELQGAYGDRLERAIPLCKVCATRLIEDEDVIACAAAAWDRFPDDPARAGEAVREALCSELSADLEPGNKGYDGFGPIRWTIPVAVLLDGRKVYIVNGRPVVTCPRQED